VNIPSTAACGFVPPTVPLDFPYEYLFNAGAVNLKLWSAGVTPPYANRYVYVGTTIQRDQYGNVLGGLRSPYVDVPISTYGLPPGGACPFIGRRTPFTPEQLAQLYRNHGSYVNQVNRNVQVLVKDGFLLPWDAALIRAEAAHAPVP
jgi:hypothetical protein